MGRLLHQVGGGLHLLQPDVHGSGDVDEHAPGSVDGSLQQGAGNGHLGGRLRLVLAGGAAHAHVGPARVLHHGGHVGEVQVDESGVLNEVRDGLHGLLQHVIGDLKGVLHGDLGVAGQLQPLVGDDDQGVHLVAQLGDPALGLLHAAAALKPEGLCDHAHGEDILLLGDVGHDRGRAGTSAAAHAGGDEHHVGPLQGLGDLGAALLCRLAAHLRVRARALPLGQLLADLDLIGGRRHGQRLLIGIHRNKIDTLGARMHHPVDDVVSTAAHTDHFDVYHTVGSHIHSEGHGRSS